MVSRDRNPRLLSAVILNKDIDRGNGELRQCDSKSPALLIKSGAIRGTMTPVSESSARLVVAPFWFALLAPPRFSITAVPSFSGADKFSAFLYARLIIGYLVGLAQVEGGLAILTGVLLAAQRLASWS